VTVNQAAVLPKQPARKELTMPNSNYILYGWDEWDAIVYNCKRRGCTQLDENTLQRNGETVVRVYTEDNDILVEVRSDFDSVVLASMN
jgi:hypothetical protein